MTMEMKVLRRREFIVNGVPVPVMANDDEILADVIRKKLGLTGTKVGCRLNQCGICSVLVDGKVVRSCVQKVGKLQDGAAITTIEGIGTPNCLHPLQLAWMKHGAAQCGFCTPGFIVSAKALLEANPNPTRQDVREWFFKNKNMCRCTGYKPIVDAVMDAAKVMRGEMKASDLEFKVPADGKIWGGYMPRPSAAAKATGTFDYGADTIAKDLSSFLHLALVQAKVSHANIISIDISEAEKMPGVVKVLTAKDIKGSNRINGFVQFPWAKNDGWDRPIICDTKVFQFGDVMAVVCADTEEHARAATKAVKVELEELPAYMDAKAAVAEDAIEIHPGTPNLYYEQPTIKGAETAPIMKEAAHTFEASYYSQRQPHLMLEPDVGYGFWADNGKLVVGCKSIGVYWHSAQIAEGLGIKSEDLLLVQNGTGGTFGYKLCATNEHFIAAAVMATGQPCALDMNMYETITHTGKRSPWFMNIKLGADKDGKLLALEADWLCDHGAYSELGDLLTMRGNQFVGAGYHIENMRKTGKCTFTNHCYGAPMRAYGSPQSYMASESAIDELARQLGEDPFEFRYKNLYDEAKGSTTPTGQKPEVFCLKQLFDMIRPKYEEAKKRKAAPAPEGIKRGVGVSLATYGAGLDCADVAEAAVELLPDGSIAVYSTWEDHGQGGEMGALATMCKSLEEMNIRPDQIKLVLNDMAKCPNSGPAAGSRSTPIVGNAIYEACDKLKKAMRNSDGTFRTYEEMVKDGIDCYQLGSYSSASVCSMPDPKTAQFAPFGQYMYGVYVTEVDVDTKTGKTTVTKMTGAFDIGNIGNRLVVEGQVYGGMHQGIGMALSEDYEDITKQTTLAKCGFPTIMDCPDNMELMFLESPRPTTALGTSGVGEIVTASPHVSIINAIADAGARVRSLPAYPDKVLAALAKG